MLNLLKGLLCADSGRGISLPRYSLAFIRGLVPLLVSGQIIYTGHHSDVPVPVITSKMHILHTLTVLLFSITLALAAPTPIKMPVADTSPGTTVQVGRFIP